MKKNTSKIFHKYKRRLKRSPLLRPPSAPTHLPAQATARRGGGAANKTLGFLSSRRAAGNSSAFPGCGGKPLPPPSQVAACFQWQRAECQGKQATNQTRCSQIRFFSSFRELHCGINCCRCVVVVVVVKI